jgi:hypothetical protein
MHWQFPTDREKKRQVLLEAVARVRDTLLAGADEAEANATLPPARSRPWMTPDSWR